jgi:hypothetical protein
MAKNLNVEQVPLIPELMPEKEIKRRRCGGCCWGVLAFLATILAAGGMLFRYTWHRGCWEKPQFTFQDWYTNCWPEPAAGLAGAHAALSVSWHVDADAPFLVSPFQQLFDHEDEDINTIPVPVAVAETRHSTSSESFAKAISASVGIEVGSKVYGFEAAAAVSANAVWSTSQNTFRQDTFVKAKKVRISRRSSHPHEHLTASARACLLEETPSTIVSRFGQFYPLSVTLGGVYQLTVMTETKRSENSKDIAAKISGSFQRFAVKGKASLMGGAASTYSKDNRQYHLKMRVLGGESTQWLGLQADNVDKIQGQWVDSITEDNMYPVGVRLRPLWELLDHDDMDREKAQALKKYMNGSRVETLGA